jgi:hypothetical protein
MSKDRGKIIRHTRLKMGEPIVRYLTDEDYNINYDLAQKIMVDTGLEREFYTHNVRDLVFVKIFHVLCKDKIEKILKEDKDGI